MRRRSCPALIALAVLLAGCTRTIDSDKASKSIARAVAERTGSKVARVDCPTGRTARAGAHFTCRVVAADGTTASLVVTETDAKGTVSVRVPLRDTAETERRMALRLSSAEHRAVGVDCPDLIPIRKGERFDCTTSSSARRGRVRAHQIDAAGTVSYERVGKGS